MKRIAFFVRLVRPRGGRLGLAAALLSLWPAVALSDPAGSVTGLPLPRYASLKTDRVNLREGPSKEHPTKWVFQRAGLPVEITAEFEIWRKVRDSEGAEGWVLHSLLSGRRTGLVGSARKPRCSRFTPGRRRTATWRRRCSPASSPMCACATGLVPDQWGGVQRIY